MFYMAEWPAVQSLVRLRSAERPSTWVTSASTFLVSRRGEVLRFPPLHNHHSNIELLPSGAVPLVLNHQDRTCSDAASNNRSYRCMLTVFPPGYGILLPESTRLLFNAAINDVRDAGSPAFSWYVEGAIRVAPPRHENSASTLRAVAIWYASHYALSNPGRFFTFDVPANTSSVVWTHHVVSISANVLKMWMHTHENSGHLATWYFDATPSALGLGSAPYQMAKCSVLVPSEIGMTLVGVQQHILDSARAEQHARGRPVLRCIAARSSSLLASTGDQQPSWRCLKSLSQRLEVGTSLTSVSFFATGATRDPTGLAMQHIHFQAYIERDGLYDAVNDLPTDDGVTSTHPGDANNSLENGSPRFPYGDCPSAVPFGELMPNPPTVGQVGAAGAGAGAGAAHAQSRMTRSESTTRTEHTLSS